MLDHKLIEKYDVPVPRYTSYPTVPYWDNGIFSEADWKQSVKAAFDRSTGGISLYLHLPFCESLCTYCACNTRITKNHDVELPYITRILKEWKMYVDVMGKRPVISELHLGGGTPTFFSPENLDRLINGLKEFSDFHDDAALSFEAHPANTSLNHLETMHALGFRRLSLGIQDFNPVVQQLVNRKQSVSEVRAISDLARIIGFRSVNFDLIYGLPKQTKESISETIRQVIDIRPDRIAFYSYAHVPWLRPGQRAYTEADLPEGAEKRDLYETGRNLLEEAGYTEVGLDHFALPGDELLQASQTGRLHRNFMGYTEKDTSLLIGLGVSAISDSGIMYSQNKKTVEEWAEDIDNDHLPLLRGHKMTREDLILKKHILNIMCKGQTSWAKEEDYCEEIQNCIQRLKTLSADGLIMLHDHSVLVTPKGKPFLRNIGACFDARLNRSLPRDPVFSKSA
ncbi:MAG: oxygen-independent coproporphyrinogen III oxidase [Bacteroidia bacterium]